MMRLISELKTDNLITNTKAFVADNVLMSPNFLVFYLYDQYDEVSKCMIRNRGKEIQNTCRFDFFTVFSENDFQNWGEKLFGYGYLKGLFQANRDDDKLIENVCSQIKRRASTMLNDISYPFIMLVGINNVGIYKGKVIPIDLSKIETNSKEEKADICYLYFLKPIIQIFNYYMYSNLNLNAIIEYIGRNFDDNISFSINNNLKGNGFSSFLSNKLFELNKRINNYKVLKGDIAEALSMNITTFNRRITNKRGFTRDELICIALFLELRLADFNELIRIYNIEFGQCYFTLREDEILDGLFMRFLLSRKTCTDYLNLRSKYSNIFEFVNAKLRDNRIKYSLKLLDSHKK